jgi:hypothetical protein
VARGKTCANWIGNVRHHYQNGAGLFGNSAVRSSNRPASATPSSEALLQEADDIHDTAAAKDAKQSVIV